MSHLAVEERVAASTQNQALSALLFLYRDVLEIDLPLTLDAVRAKRSKHIPTVLTQNEVAAILMHLSEPYLLMVQLLYGSGLRLMECLRLRVKDLDIAQHSLVVHDGKGMRDRVTMLPSRVIEPLQAQLHYVRHGHAHDRVRGYGVSLPFALERKYPHAHVDWGWQYLFPAERLARDPRTSIVRRHHVHERGLQYAVRNAGHQAGIAKRVGCHAFRHSFATHVL